MVALFWRGQKSRFLVLDSITQHVAGKDFAVFLPEHVLHLPGQEIAIILTGHMLRLRLEHGLGLFGARVPEFSGFVHNNRGFGARVLGKHGFRNSSPFWEATVPW